MRSNLLSAMVCVTVLTLVGVGYGAIPADYHDSFVPHLVVIPKLQAAAELQTDLSQPPWDKAAMLTGNLDTRRIRTAGVPVWTYLFYDSQSLWVGYRSETKSGKSLKASVRQREGDMKKDDYVTFELDPGPSGRVFYRFVINPLGTLRDSVIIDKDWNSHAKIKTATDDKGWTAVIRVPFSDFGHNEPAVGARWTFNVSSRTGIENHWASVLGGYHTPEEFAGLVFGGEKARPVRMLDFQPLRAGDNSFHLQAPAGTCYLLETVDRQKRTLSRQDGPVGKNGSVNFQLHDDRVEHVNFTFKDANGKTHLSFWRPAEMPELLSRLPALREKAALVRQAMKRFPKAAYEKAEPVVAEMDAFVAKPSDSFYKNWDKLHKQLGNIERRLTNAWLYAQTLAKLSPKASFAVALATPMDKVMIKDFPCPGQAAAEYDLYLARNEHEAVQVVVIPMTGALKDATVTASFARSKKGVNASAIHVTSALVGHVKTLPAGSYMPDYVGWYPDPILPFQQKCNIAEGEHVAFWVDVAADKDARAGYNESTITVAAEGCEPLKIRLNIHIWDIELPQGTHLKNAFTYAKSRTKQVYKKQWSNEIAKRYNDFILDHRLNIDSLYGKDDLDIGLLKDGVAKGMNAFNLFYVGKGMATEVLRSLLEERVPPLKEAGVYKYAYLYGFDEVNDEVFPRIKELFGLAHTMYPDLPRMTTGYDNTFGRTTGLRDYVDIWVPLIPRYNMIEADRLRAEGKQMWWYLCVGPRHPYPNWFVESPTIEARLIMGTMSYKYRVDGVLYFLINGWKNNEQPIKSGPYTTWCPGAGPEPGGAYANGDGSLFCAGPDGPLSTLRFEGVRDGLEDYEYLYMLAEVVVAVAKQPTNLVRAEFVQRARDLLDIPEQVVASSSQFTDDPVRLYDFRRTVAQAIMEGRGLAR